MYKRQPQNQQNSNVSYQPKKGTFFKKKIIYGFFMFIVFLIILLTFRKEIFSSDDTNQNNKKIIKNEVSKDVYKRQLIIYLKRMVLKLE